MIKHIKTYLTWYLLLLFLLLITGLWMHFDSEIRQIDHAIKSHKNQ